MTRDLGVGSGASGAIGPNQPSNSEASLWVEGVRAKGRYRLQEWNRMGGGAGLGSGHREEGEEVV